MSRLVFLFLLMPSLALGQSTVGPTHRASPPTGKGVLKQDNVCGNASAANRTFSWSNNGAVGYAVAAWWVQFTDGAGANGALTFACTVSRDENATDYIVTSCNTSGGKCTLVFPTGNTIFETPTLAGDSDFWVRWDLLGAADYECTVAHGGAAGADDCWTLHAQLITD